MKHTLCRLLTMSLLIALSSLAYAHDDWYEPFPPFRIIGNLYYVGSRDLANYLVVTPKGNILINTGPTENIQLLKNSIRKLGFKLSDIKTIVISQAHADHIGGIAKLKKLTGAKLAVMQADIPLLESGGKKDFLFANDQTQWYPPTKVDQALHDNEKLTLDGTTLTAHLTPGHTKGCTTWTMQAIENGRQYNVVIVGGTAMNPGTKLFKNATYPNITADYAQTWRVLKSLPCDIFLGAHGIYFKLTEKYSDNAKQQFKAFIDPNGYRDFLKSSEATYNKELARQQKTLPEPNTTETNNT